MIHKNQITITTVEGNLETIFDAPENRELARVLWAWLIENLRPGLVVELQISIYEKLTHQTGEKIPIELYSAVMGRAE